MRVLALLAGIEPSWCLTGGAALAGVHTRHRSTRDLDLFWRNRSDLKGLTPAVIEAIEESGLEVEKLHSSRTFQRLRVCSGEESLVVDLVADAVPAIDPPAEACLEGIAFAIDSAHDILVNKLCTLIERAELRDLDDVRALLDSGGNLQQALADAPRKDGGFSPLTLAWLLKELPIESMARQEGRSAEETERLQRFRSHFIDLLATATRPE